MLVCFGFARGGRRRWKEVAVGVSASSGGPQAMDMRMCTHTHTPHEQHTHALPISASYIQMTYMYHLNIGAASIVHTISSTSYSPYIQYTMYRHKTVTRLSTHEP